MPVPWEFDTVTTTSTFAISTWRSPSTVGRASGSPPGRGLVKIGWLTGAA
jgi:hypothetical protein